MPTPEEYAAARLAARAAAYREQVARLRQLVTPPAYLDARRARGNEASEGAEE